MRNNIIQRPLSQEAEQTKTTEVVMTTLEISNIMGMEHKNVLRKMRGLVEVWNKAKGGECKIELTSYIDTQTKARPMYVLNEKQARFVLCSFNPQLLLKVLNRYDELEAENKALRENSYDKETQEALQALSDFARFGFIEPSEMKLYAMTLLPPKAREALPTQVTMEKPLYSVTELLKMHDKDLSAQKFNKLLCEYGYLEETFKINKMHKGYRLTAKGQEYGKVTVNSDDNGRIHEGVTKFYDDKFEELYSKVVLN